MIRLRRILTMLLVLAATISPVMAVEPDEILDDPVLEQRAREISAELRCMVCQNQSIDDSNAELARDLRILVRDRLQAGDSNEEVFDYVVSRYGEFVLLKPRFSLKTAALWAAPAALLLIGIGAVVAFLRGGRKGPARGEALSEAEQRELDRVLAERRDAR